MADVGYRRSSIGGMARNVNTKIAITANERCFCMNVFDASRLVHDRSIEPVSLTIVQACKLEQEM